MEVQRDPSGHSSFVAGPRPACGFSFSGPSSPRAGLMRTRLKRPRPRTDVDGERSGESGKKKRRLRLFLITSRLSPPFSTPPTYIVGRGSSKIAIWAKQKALGRNLLRKAAILNHVRMRAAKVQEANSGQMERTRRSFIERQFSVARVPHRQQIPLPPSPLGLSNYDAFDLEDGLPYEDDGGEGEGCAIYSDFNVLEPTEPVTDDYDSLNEIDSLPPKHRPPSPPSEKVLDIRRERERQREVSFVRFGES